MTRSLLSLSLLVLGCGATAPNTPPPSAPPAHGSASRVLELPAAAGSEPRQVRVVVDEPGLKLATIVLRGGTVLPTHHASVPVTIVALAGTGTVTAGADKLGLDPTHAVMLAPGVPHSVEPAPGTDLVLLVHHLGRGEDHH